MQRVVTNPARAYADYPHLLIRVPRSVMLVKNYKQHPKKAGRTGCKATFTSDRSMALEPAVLYLVAVLACAIALVLCAALGDSVGVDGVATALVGVLTVRASAERKAP